MGAATSLLHGERDPSIAGMILDSAFSDLTVLAEEIVDKGRKNGLFVPGFVVYIAIRWIRSSVMKTAKFDIRHLSPIKHANKCYIPALFVAGVHSWLMFFPFCGVWSGLRERHNIYLICVCFYDYNR